MPSLTWQIILRVPRPLAAKNCRNRKIVDETNHMNNQVLWHLCQSGSDERVDRGKPELSRAERGLVLVDEGGLEIGAVELSFKILHKHKHRVALASNINVIVYLALMRLSILAAHS
jgi:hypothetical protein